MKIANKSIFPSCFEHLFVYHVFEHYFVQFHLFIEHSLCFQKLKKIVCCDAHTKCCGISNRQKYDFKRNIAVECTPSTLLGTYIIMQFYAQVGPVDSSTGSTSVGPTK